MILRRFLEPCATKPCKNVYKNASSSFQQVRQNTEKRAIDSVSPSATKYNFFTFLSILCAFLRMFATHPNHAARRRKRELEESRRPPPVFCTFER